MKTIQILIFFSLIYTNIKSQPLKELLPPSEVTFNAIETWDHKGEKFFGELKSSQNANTKLHIFSLDNNLYTYIEIVSSIFKSKFVFSVMSTENFISKDDKTLKLCITDCKVTGDEGDHRFKIQIVYKDEKLIECHLDSNQGFVIKFHNKL